MSLYVKNGSTALVYASEHGHTATVEVLLSAGADMEAKDDVRSRVREMHTYTVVERV